MKPDVRVRIVVLLEGGSEPITGTVCIEDGEPRPFQGWIELAQAIGTAHAEPSATRRE